MLYEYVMSFMTYEYVMFIYSMLIALYMEYPFVCLIDIWAIFFSYSFNNRTSSYIEVYAEVSLFLWKTLRQFTIQYLKQQL